jgi:hypothetical protein
MDKHGAYRAKKAITSQLSGAVEELQAVDSEKALASIAALARAITQTDAALHRTVEIARYQGHTWQEIGAELGMTRQAAWERFRNQKSAASS